MFDFSSKDFFIESLNKEQHLILEDIHTKCFSIAWSAEDFLKLLLDPSVLGFGGYEQYNTRMVGFILVRYVLPQAEVLTFSVLEKYRSCGLGWKLLHEALEKLYIERVGEVFLEVEEQNIPALKLYRRMGFFEVGKREHYYPSKDGKPPATALVMKRTLKG